MKIADRFPLVLNLLMFFGFTFFIISCSDDSSDENPVIEIETGTVSDIEGNVYKTVKIGSQWWMAENLKTTKYNDGRVIPVLRLTNTLPTPSSGAYYWYDNDSIKYAKTYGALYNFHTIKTRRLCPQGWHIPSMDEWAMLEKSVKNFVATRLKEPGTSHWRASDLNTVNSPVSNSTGFTALPAGIAIPKNPGGSMRFDGLGEDAAWWSSRQVNESNSEGKSLTWNRSSLNYFSRRAYIGHSCRCVKD